MVGVEIMQTCALWSREEGDPYPLGQSWVESEESYNFALYSKHAEAVTLLLFGNDDLTTPLCEYEFDRFKNKTHRVWHFRVPRSETKGAAYYAYRIDGPETGAGFERHAFDPDKLALDPYARRLFFPPDFTREAATGGRSNIGRAPLAVLCPDNPEHADLPLHKARHEPDLVIYELHVRGFTMSPSSGVEEGKRGTFGGVVEKIPYLVDLGITAVELMPVFQFDPSEGNYWGYNPLSFFAPHAGYAQTPARVLEEFRAMVEAFHQAGIEVYLDVVYNHTCEGGVNGPSYTLSLIDNSTYYLVNPRTGDYMDFSGTGNSLHVANAATRHLIVNSLIYWVRDMGVDGYRFDLASVFTRADDGSVNIEDPAIFGQIAAEPELNGARLFAEPWDAAGAYQLGRNFPGATWRQWNGRYRDAIKRFCKGDPGVTAEMTRRIYGSDDLFPDELPDSYRPYQSVNYIASHDGFTLYDLVSFDEKHNEANGENNQDGPDEPSWNSGWEGDENVPDDVVTLRHRRIKNFIALLMVSNGTPMIRMGDEFGHTQRGNSNPYNQDNETSWLDWTRHENKAELYRFTKMMIAFRKRNVTLNQSTFWRDRIAWFGPEGPLDVSAESRALAYWLKGPPEQHCDLYVMSNQHAEEVEFAIQREASWGVAIDSAKAPPGDIHEHHREPAVNSGSYVLRPYSTVVLVQCPS